MHADTEIRPYRPEDRASVREVCYRTGYMGDEVDWLWRDQDSFSDMFSLYYTDGEPESALVATIDGVVRGYLLGCLDSRRAWDPGKIMGRHIVRRAIALRPGTAGVIWRTFGDGALDLALRRVRMADYFFADPRWPAHLHIDLMPDARGGTGRRLINRWFDTLAANGITGCHLGTMAENSSAIAFFEAVGFRRHGDPTLIPGFRTRSGQRMHAQIMVVDLPASRACR